MPLLRDAATRTGLFRKRAACFVDHRSPRSIEQMVAQRVLGIASAYEDLADHDHLRDHVLSALAAG